MARTLYQQVYKWECSVDLLRHACSCVTDGYISSRILIKIVCIKVRFMVQINLELSNIAEDWKFLSIN